MVWGRMCIMKQSGRCSQMIFKSGWQSWNLHGWFSCWTLRLLLFGLTCLHLAYRIPGRRLWSQFGRTYGCHLCKCVDQVIQFHREALQTFLYFPREMKKDKWVMFPLSWPISLESFPCVRCGWRSQGPCLLIWSTTINSKHYFLSTSKSHLELLANIRETFVVKHKTNCNISILTSLNFSKIEIL